VVEGSPAGGPAGGSRDTGPIPRAQCLRLLASVPFGRLVFTEEALPAVHPVNHVVQGSDVIIRTESGRKLDAARRGDVVAFQADHIDEQTRTGWSVLLIGHAAVVTDIDELVAAIDPHRRPWARGRGRHVVRIRGERITGRRLLSDPAQDG
jgi:nitroimidazol reductase NimA-like FMN-containing flavoprotein (pyridoxamine 5'-phosphate oxidase superfamily)